MRLSLGPHGDVSISRQRTCLWPRKGHSFFKIKSTRKARTLDVKMTFLWIFMVKMQGRWDEECKMQKGMKWKWKRVEESNVGIYSTQPCRASALIPDDTHPSAQILRRLCGCAVGNPRKSQSAFRRVIWWIEWKNRGQLDPILYEREGYGMKATREMGKAHDTAYP